jgi:hypothetical protein
VNPRSTGVKIFAACAAFRAAVVISLLYAVALQGSSNQVRGIDIVVKKEPGGGIVAHQKAGDSGTFRFENLPAGSYTIEASPSTTETQTSSTAAQRPTPNIPLSATVTFEHGGLQSPNARSKAAAPSVTGPHIANGTMLLQLKGTTQGRFFSEDFTITGGPATITGKITGGNAGGKPSADRVNSELEQAADNSTPQALAPDPKLGTGNGPHLPPPPVQAAASIQNTSKSNVKNNGLAVDSAPGQEPNNPNTPLPFQGQTSAISTSRSNIGHNLQMPLNVTGATCNGTASVSVATNYAPPQGSLWVFSNLTTRKAIATLDQPNQAASPFQFAVDASKGNVSLVIQNSVASPMTSPYAISCSSSASTAGTGNGAQGDARVNSELEQVAGKESSVAQARVAAPATCPNLNLTESARATNSVVGANTLLALTNDGPGAALSVTVTRMSCSDGFVYTAPNGSPTIPFVVPGAANLAQGASTKFSAFFKKAGLTQTGSFSCSITYTEGKSCPSRTATVSIR